MKIIGYLTNSYGVGEWSVHENKDTTLLTNKLKKMPNKEGFIFTPGQRKEALDWIESNCDDLKYHLDSMELDSRQPIETMIIDIYFKMKSISFPMKPTEFVVGIEYQDEQSVINGTEYVNIALINPRDSKDQFAFQILIELMNRLKG